MYGSGAPYRWSFTPLRSGRCWERTPLGVMIQVPETVQSPENMLAMNEALMLGSLLQHELTEFAEREITARKLVEETLAKTIAELAGIQSARSEEHTSEL